MLHAILVRFMISTGGSCIQLVLGNFYKFLHYILQDISGLTSISLMQSTVFSLNMMFVQLAK